jgi:hypothetical protein
MAEQIVNRPPKRHRFLKIIGVIFLVLILLLVVGYFVLTSAAFFKGVILPRASKELNAEITVSDVSISPFKQVILRDLKVTPHGQETLLTAPEVRARYALMDIIKGNINVDEVGIMTPTVTLVENADGSHNYDPLVKQQTEKPAAEKKSKEEEKKSSKPPRLNLKKFVLTDGTIRQVKNYKGGAKDSTEISKLNITLDDLRNGGTGKLTLGAELAIQNNPPAPGTNGTLQARVNGNFSLALSDDLKPASIQGGTKLQVAQATGAFAEVANLGANFACDVTPKEVKQVALTFAKGNNQLGRVLVSGPFDMEKTEGKLTAQVIGIDKQVLNLAGASSGLDFGPTTLNSTNQIELTKSGNVMTASGAVSLAKMQVTRDGQTTPPLDFVANYDVTVDNAASNAVLRVLTVNGTQKGNQFLKTELTSPMTIAWGNTQNAVGDSTLNVTLSKFNLADWKAFATNISSGLVDAQAKIVSQQAGKLVTFNLDTKVSDLSATSGSNQLSQATVTIHAEGKATDLKQFNLNSYQLDFQHQGQQVVTVKGTVAYDTASQAADVSATLQAAIPQLLALSPQPETQFSGGKMELVAHVTQQAQPGKSGTTASVTQIVTGQFKLSELTGNLGSNNFNNFAASMNLDIAKTEEQLQIRKLTGQISENGKQGGGFDVSGTYHTNQNAQLTAKLINFNENGLRPFLEPALGDKKLATVVLNGIATVQSNPNGDSQIKAELSVTNLVVNDPQNQIPATPLEMKLAMDTSLKKQVVDIRQLAVTLTPTERAKNELNLTGHIDGTDTNAIQGNIKVAAESLDVTRYYDIFGGDKKVEEKKKEATEKANTPAPSSPTTAPSGPEKEPDAMKLPFRNFTAVADIKAFYLRETTVSNLQATAKIDGGHVTVNPFQLALNGAPVNATVDADVGVPGYKYNVAYNMNAVPLAPLVNSFAPERKGQIGGTMTAALKVSGAGITGPNIQKNLAGNFDVTSTNLNLSVVDIKNRMLKTIINVVATIPELIKNPAGGALSTLGSLTGLGSGGLTEDLKKSPINTIDVHAVAGSGKVDLKNAVVSSSAFEASAQGNVVLAEVLTNSTLQVPVRISLSQALAKKVNLLPADAPTNAQYAALPDFFTMKGTVGNPKSDIKYSALGGIALKAFGGGSAGNAISSLLGGKKGSGANAPDTNKNENLIKGIGGLLNNQSSGNTNTTSTTNQAPPAEELFKKGLNLFGPKKK